MSCAFMRAISPKNVKRIPEKEKGNFRKRKREFQKKKDANKFVPPNW
jgi:hypothetical protein